MKIIIHYLLVLIAAKLFFLTIIFFLVAYDWVELPVHQAKESIQQRSGWYAFALIGLIGPVLEESMFRLALVFKPIYASIACAILYLYLYSFFTGIALDSLDLFATRAVTASLLFLLIYCVCFHYRRVLSNGWKRYRRSLVLILSFLFGLFHLINYDLQHLSFLSSLVVVVPYFTSGYIYSQARLNYNFGLCVCLHVLFNSLGFLVTLF